MSMKYISMELGPIMTNCYIVYDTDTKEAMVVDPAWDYPAIDKALPSHFAVDTEDIPDWQKPQPDMIHQKAPSW